MYKTIASPTEAFSDEITALVTVCQEIANDRKNHIIDIETARGKQIFDKHCEFPTSVIELI